MADIPVPQARKGILERNKWILFVFTSCLMVFSTLWLMFVHVNRAGLLYPHDKSLKRIPDHWLYRAIAYNTYDPSKINFTDHLTIPAQIPRHPASIQPEFKLVCYYNFPSEASLYRRLHAEDLDTSLCTHINVAFGVIYNNSLYLSEEHAKSCRTLADLKKNQTELKLLLSVGGAGVVEGFSEMVFNHENRKTFIKSISDFIKEYNFDGVDLDWEFPGGDAPADGKQRMHFTQLLREIRNEINRQKKHKFLLTLAVAAPVFIVDTAYDIKYINEYVDFINLMTYDYHFYTKWTPFTGINAPLYPLENESGYMSTLNINYSAHYWVHKGMDRQKVVVGLPTYGHSFRLLNSANNGIMSPANGYGSLGLNGFTGYNDVCIFLAKNQIAPVFNMATRSPYATRNHEWISFDDTQSISYKAEFIKNNNFGGAMLYALNTDDHRGLCNGKDRFPLTKKVKEILTRGDL